MMNRSKILILLALLFIGAIMAPKHSQAQRSQLVPPTNILDSTFYYYKGTIGKTKIGLYVGPDYSGGLIGYYYYYSDLKDRALHGTVLGPRSFKLYGNSDTLLLEFNRGDMDNITGKWISRSGHADSIYLTPKGTVSGPSIMHDSISRKLFKEGALWREDTTRYGSSIPDSEIEQNIQGFYFAVLNKKPKLAIGYVDFPFTAWLANGKRLHFQTSSQLLRKWNKIFTAKFLTDLKQYVPHDLFVNEDGIMLGLGQIWFDHAGFANSVFTVPFPKLRQH